MDLYPRSNDISHSGSYLCKFDATGGLSAHYVRPFGANGILAGSEFNCGLMLYIPSSWGGSGIKLIDISDGSWESGYLQR